MNKIIHFSRILVFLGCIVVFGLVAYAQVRSAASASSTTYLPMIAKYPKPPDTGAIAFNSDRDGDFEIYSMRSDGSAVTQLTVNLEQDFSPDWSPDGARIVFVSERDGNAEIYAMNADGSNQTRLTVDPGIDGAPVWSPNGTKIAFEADRDGDSGIYTMNADGTNVIKLISAPAGFHNPSWSPDGTKIAYVAEDGVRIINADGTNPALFYGIVDLNDLEWSLDGTKFVLSAIDKTWSYEIFVLNISDLSLIQLTNTVVPELSPYWSPTGAQIVYVNEDGSNTEIFTMYADGSYPTQITNNPGADSAPSWKP